MINDLVSISANQQVAAILVAIYVYLSLDKTMAETLMKVINI